MLLRSVYITVSVYGNSNQGSCKHILYVYYVTHSHQLCLNSELAYCARSKSSQWGSVWVFSDFCKIRQSILSINIKLWCVCTDSDTL